MFLHVFLPFFTKRNIFHDFLFVERGNPYKMESTVKEKKFLLAEEVLSFKSGPSLRKEVKI